MHKRSNNTRSLLASSALLGLLATTSLLGGCGYARQVRDDVPPRAVPDMVAAQTLNPEAGKNRKVVTGMDGQVAQNIDKGHTKSFERQDTAKRASEAFTGVSGLSN